MSGKADGRLRRWHNGRTALPTLISAAAHQGNRPTRKESERKPSGHKKRSSGAPASSKLRLPRHFVCLRPENKHEGYAPAAEGGDAMATLTPAACPLHGCL